MKGVLNIGLRDAHDGRVSVGVVFQKEFHCWIGGKIKMAVRLTNPRAPED